MDDTDLMAQDQQRIAPDMESEATFNLRLYQHDNAEQTSIAIDKEKDTGFPASWWMAQDNADTEPLSASGLDYNFQKLIAENPERVATYKDQLPQLNEVSKTLSRSNLTPAQRAKKEKIPALETMGQGEREYVEKMAENLSHVTRIDESTLTSLPDFNAASPEQQQAIAALAVQNMQKRLTVMNYLDKEFPGWRSADDAHLDNYIEAAKNLDGMDVSGIDKETLRKGGALDVNYWKMFNFFGWQDVAEAYSAVYGDRNPEMLAAINPKSSLADQLKLLEYLDSESLNQRGMTTWGNVVDVAVQAVPFMAEFAVPFAGAGGKVIRGGMAAAMREAGFKGGIRAGLKALGTAEGWKGLAKASGVALKGEALRTPLFLTRDVAQSIQEWEKGPVYLPGVNGEMQTVVPEQKVEEFFNILARTVVKDYLGRSSEWSGNLMPEMNVSDAIARIMPQGFKNAMVKNFLHTAASDSTKRGVLGSFISDLTPLNGSLNEIAEEYVNNAMERIVTVAGQTMDVAALDLGRENVFDGWDEFNTITLSSLLIGELGRAAKSYSRYGSFRNTLRQIDDQRDLVDKLSQTPMERNSPRQMEDAVRGMRGGDMYFYLDPEASETLFQEEPELCAAVGLTPQKIGDARNGGHLLTVSSNALAVEMAKSPEASAAGEKLMASTITAEGDEVKEASQVDLSQEAIAAYTQRREKAEELAKTIYTHAADAAISSGVPKTAVQSFSTILSFMAKHLSEHTNLDMEKIASALKIQLFENPEEFESKTDIIRSAVAKVLPDDPAEAPANAAPSAVQVSEEEVNAVLEKFLPEIIQQAERKVKGQDINSQDLISHALVKLAGAIRKEPNGKEGYYRKTIIHAFNDILKSQGRRSKNTVSLQSEIGSGENSDSTLEDKIAANAEVRPDSNALTRESEKGIQSALSELSEKEKQLLTLLQKHHGNDAAVGRELGISREAVRKRHKALWNKLAQAADLNVTRYQQDTVLHPGASAVGTDDTASGFAGLRRDKQPTGSMAGQDGQSRFAVNERQIEKMHESEQKVAEEIKNLTNGIRFDTISIAPIRQAMERNIQHLPEKVKENLLKSFDTALSKKRAPGFIRPMDPAGFVTAMTSFGFQRDGSTSAYMTVGENTVRLSYHDASAKTFKEHGESGNVIVSISLRKPNQQGKQFQSDDAVNMVEYVFPIGTVTKEKLAGLIYDMGNFFATGEYTDHVGAAEFHVSGSEEFKAQAIRKAVSDQRAAVIAKYKGTPQWLKAPNGKDSHLTEDQWIAVRTPFFKEFFGDWENDPEHSSKVVDENGETLVVYHGTDENFTVFDMDKSRANMDIRGAFFSPWEDDSRGYGKNVGAFYLSIKNPASGAEAYKALNLFKGQNNAGVKARDYLIRKGYDGVNVDGEEYIAFYPEQIKSATDNIGTFDRSNPDIRYQEEFRNVRDTLDEETGEKLLDTPARYNYHTLLEMAKKDPDFAKKLKEVYDAFPDGVSDPWGKSVSLKMPDGKNNRLWHFVTEGGKGDSERSNVDFNKIQWLPRVPGTVSHAQIRLQDTRPDANGKHNFAYVRRYPEGFHVVVTTEDGVFVGQQEYDTAAITQFKEDGSRNTARDYFTVEKTREEKLQEDKTPDAPLDGTPAAAESLIGSNPTSPVAGDTIYPTAGEIKRLLQKSFKKNGVIRGAYRRIGDFKESFDAVIGLFRGKANASTLPHEAAHYLLDMMRTLCSLTDEKGEPVADQQLRDELASIEKWLDRQQYKAKEGTKEYLEERDEKFARAFEEYIRTGKPPASSVQAAFNTLKHYFMTIYRATEKLGAYFGFTMDDDIREVFDSIFSSEETFQRDSDLAEAQDVLAADFQSLMDLSKEETGDYIKLIAHAKAQTQDAIERRKKQLLPRLKKEWRSDAEDAMNAMKVYQAYAEIRANGKLDPEALAACSDVDAETLKVLKKMGLVAKGGEEKILAPVDAAHRSGYASIGAMVQELISSVTPEEFVKRFMAQQQQIFNRNFAMDEKATAAAGTIKLLDRLAADLAQKAGVDLRERREAAKAEMQKKVGLLKVSQILSKSSLLESAKRMSRKLTHAIAKKDYGKALEYAQEMRSLLNEMREVAEAKETIEKTARKIKRAAHAGRGHLFGDYGDAVKELAYYFGFSTKEPPARSANRPSARAAAPGLNYLGEYFDAPFQWPDFLLSNEVKNYKELTCEEFQSLADFADFLIGTGRDMVQDRKGSFAAKVKEDRENCLKETEQQKHKYTASKDKKSLAETVSAGTRGFFNYGKMLYTFLGQADRWRHRAADGVRGPFIKLYDQLATGNSRSLGLAQNALSICKSSVDKLHTMLKEKKISLPGVPFRENQFYSYSRWTPEMVIAACLNMGNEGNRQRLISGFGWTEEDLNEIARCLPKEAWEEVQKIWDAISGDLREAVAETFLAENHYELRMVPAQEFDVNYADGSVMQVRGGYYPIAYAHRTKGKDVALGFTPQALYAIVSSVQQRQDVLENCDPLNLSMHVLTDHIAQAAEYAGLRMPLRHVLSVMRNPDMEKEFIATQSKENYDSVMALLKNMANPDHGSEPWVNKLKGIMVSSALMFNLKTVGMQFASLPVGAQELGQYYARSWASIGAGIMPWKIAGELSGVMKHRRELAETDLQSSIRSLDETPLQWMQRNSSRVGYLAMKGTDVMVASIGWYGKYLQMMDQLKVEEANPEVREKLKAQAIAAADDFVARTQGESGSLNMTRMQLSKAGKLFTAFICAASAQYNNLLSDFGAFFAHRLSGYDAALCFLCDLLYPAAVAGLATAVFNGGFNGDDDDQQQYAWKLAAMEALCSPFGGMPILRDLSRLGAAEIVDTLVDGKKIYKGDPVDIGYIDSAKDVISKVISAADSIQDGEFGRAGYIAADGVSQFLRVPAIRIYERMIRRYTKMGGELPQLLQDLNESVKKERTK